MGSGSRQPGLPYERVSQAAKPRRQLAGQGTAQWSHFIALPTGGDTQAGPSSAKAQGAGRPAKSALKSFALALSEFEEPTGQQTGGARAMQARSKRVSSVASSLLKGLEVEHACRALVAVVALMNPPGRDLLGDLGYLKAMQARLTSNQPHLRMLT